MVIMNTCSKTFTKGFVKSFAKPQREKQQVVSIKVSKYSLGIIGVFVFINKIKLELIDNPINL